MTSQKALLFFRPEIREHRFIVDHADCHRAPAAIVAAHMIAPYPEHAERKNPAPDALWVALRRARVPYFVDPETDLLRYLCAGVDFPGSQRVPEMATAQSVKTPL